MSDAKAPTRLRSVLFVPGDRPDRFEKALATGADAICLDLEDGVAPDAKAGARRNVLTFLDAFAPLRSRLIIRTNPLGSRDGLHDLLALAELDEKPTIMSPKVEHPQTLTDARAVLSESGSAPDVIALIESARGLRHAADIAAVPGVVAIALGAVDLAAQLGSVFDPATMALLRLTLKTAAAEAGVAVLDGPWLDIADADGLSCSADAAAAMGFDGKLAIHPSQVETVQAAFSPTAHQVATARRIVEMAADAAGVFQLEGRMIDRPVVIAARRLLGRAGA